MENAWFIHICKQNYIYIYAVVKLNGAGRLQE